MCKSELRFTGSGGQGVILSTIIMAEAAFLDGKNVVQSQSYGPEARGGMCKAELLVDEKAVNYTKVTKPTCLLSLTQQSFDKYKENLADDAVLVIDNSINVPTSINTSHKVYKLPILDSAKTIIKNPMSANIISVGAVNEVLSLTSKESLEDAVTAHIPKGTKESNVNAMNLGAKLVKEYV
ncbi:MAG TPA: 2-oxoacid:acceptor oxidoreductase family protein [Anaerovoracaceae bacterium]|nr:2-oxoacid:acceptor oxidoreductase family protein [Anaerovoracaceae bacterium]